MAHVKMMANVQPLLSGSISKTINMSNEATIDDVKRVYFESWRLALKSIALYRDGCKLSQPLSTALSHEEEIKQASPKRKRLPNERTAITHKFRVGNQEGYITVGLFEDGTPGELFVTMSKEGSTLSGLMGSFALTVSIALQYGVPLKALVNKLIHTRYEPSGWTDNPQIQIAKSLTDYIARWMALKFLPREELAQIGLNNIPHVETIPMVTKPEEQKNLEEFKEDRDDSDAPTCDLCGSLMIRSGTCYLCMNCGSTTGCS
jgi:ribonucleoside-diphosphate reductase alpha chain